jgi:hypothetical protein
MNSPRGFPILAPSADKGNWQSCKERLATRLRCRQLQLGCDFDAPGSRILACLAEALAFKELQCDTASSFDSLGEVHDLQRYRQWARDAQGNRQRLRRVPCEPALNHSAPSRDRGLDHRA